MRNLDTRSGKYNAYRWQSAAMGALQEAAEAHLIALFESELAFQFY